MSKVEYTALRIHNGCTWIMAFLWFPGFIIGGILYWYVLNEASWAMMALLEWMACGCILTGIFFITKAVATIYARIYLPLIIIIPMGLMGCWAGVKTTERVIKEITEQGPSPYAQPEAAK